MKINSNLFKAIKFSMQGNFLSKYASSTIVKDNFMKNQKFLNNSSINNDFVDLFLNNAYINPETNIDDAKSINNFFSEGAIAYYKTKFNFAQKKLSAKEFNNVSPFEKIVFRRSTSYKLQDTYILKQDLIKFLKIGLGLNPLRNNRKNYASAGGLYCVEVMFYLHNVKTIPNGFYKFDDAVNDICLIEQVNLSQEQLAEIIRMQVDHFNIILFYVFNHSMVAFKYGRAAARFGLIETGIIMHHLDLTATSLQWTGHHIGAYNRTKVKEYLHLQDGLDIYITNVSILGKAHD